MPCLRRISCTSLSWEPGRRHSHIFYVYCTQSAATISSNSMEGMLSDWSVSVICIHTHVLQISTYPDIWPRDHLYIRQKRLGYEEICSARLRGHATSNVALPVLVVQLNLNSIIVRFSMHRRSTLSPIELSSVGHCVGNSVLACSCQVASSFRVYPHSPRSGHYLHGESYAKVRQDIRDA